MGFGILALVAPGRAAGVLGAIEEESGDRLLFLASVLGSFLVPWGAGLLLAARADHATRLWTGLALVQTLTASFVTIFFLGRGVLGAAIAAVFLAVFVLGAAGIGVFGYEELRGALGDVNVVFRRDRNAGSQKPYTIKVDEEDSSEDG